MFLHNREQRKAKDEFQKLKEKALQILLLFVIIIFICSSNYASALPIPGTIYVIDPDAGTNNHGALFHVDSLSGNRTMVSDFGDYYLGTLGSDPVDVTVFNSTHLMVIDYTAGPGSEGALFSVNMTDGTRMVVSNFTYSFQGPGFQPFRVANFTDTLFVIDGHKIIGIDSKTGIRTTLSDFFDLTNYGDGYYANPFDIYINATGNIFVLVTGETTDFVGSLLLVDPNDGFRTGISYFGLLSQGPLASNPNILTRDIFGNIITIDNFSGTDGDLPAVFSIDPRTGIRTIISDFSDPSQGSTATFPTGITTDGFGNILVAFSNYPSGPAKILEIDAITGVREVVTDFSDITQGPIGSNPSGIDFVPAYTEYSIFVLDNQTGTSYAGTLVSVDRRNGVRAIISDFGNPNQGPTGADPVGFTFNASRIPLVVDSGYNGNGWLFAVNPITGVRTILSDFSDSNQGPPLFSPKTVDVNSTQHIHVLESTKMYNINPDLNGLRTVFSDFNNPVTGFLIDSATDFAVDYDDNFYVVDKGDPIKGLVRINPSGYRSHISDFENAVLGPTLSHPHGIAFVSTSTLYVIDPDAGTFSNGQLISVSLPDGRRTIISDFNNPPLGANPVALDNAGHPTFTFNVIIDKDFGSNGNGALFLDSIYTGTPPHKIISDFNNPIQGLPGKDPIDVRALKSRFDYDSIENLIDELPTVYSTSFSDIPRGGTTNGAITSQGNVSLIIEDLPNNLGVLIRVAGGYSGVPTLVEVCDGAATLSFTSRGQSAVVTCTSVSIQIIQGPILVSFTTNSGTAATTLNSGANIMFDPESGTLINNGTNPVTINALVRSGESIVIPEFGTFGIIIFGISITSVIIVARTKFGLL